MGIIRDSLNKSQYVQAAEAMERFLYTHVCEKLVTNGVTPFLRGKTPH